MRHAEFVHIHRRDLDELRHGDGRVHIGVLGACAWTALAVAAGWLIGIWQSAQW